MEEKTGRSGSGSPPEELARGRSRRKDARPARREALREAEKYPGRSRRKPDPTLFEEIASWVQVVLIAVLIALFVDTFIIANSVVPTGSMENTIMPDNRVIGFRLSYYFEEPERGDIVIFLSPDEEAKGNRTYYVKRLIGLPGDTVDIRDGGVYLNGDDTPLDEPYLREPMKTEKEQHFSVPEDSYFFLGDNRNHSSDSRRWKNPYVKRKKLTAKVLFRYFPGFRWLDNQDEQ